VKTARVGDLATQVRGVTFAKEDATSDQLPGSVGVVRAGNIVEGELQTDDLVFVPVTKVAEKQILRRHDVLIAASSGSLDVVGKAARVREDQAVAFGAFCKVLRPSNKIDPGYFAHYFQTIEYRRHVSSVAAGANINNLKNADLDDIEIPLPPIAEQRRIASILDAADALRTKRRHSLAKLETLTQAIFLDAFGDPVSNPFGWPTMPLAEVVQGKAGVKAGPFGSSLLKADYTESGYRVYGQEQVIAGRFDIGNYFISQEKYDQLSSCAVGIGDLLISLVGSFGKVLVVPPNTPAGIINPRLLKITPDQNRTRSRFLASLLETSAVQRFLHGAAHGGTMGVLNAALVKAVSVMTPPIELQIDFEHRLTALEEMMRPSHKAATVQDALFASLQQRAFRGEL
jgi:type I restriction enzyme S subunit